MNHTPGPWTMGQSHRDGMSYRREIIRPVGQGYLEVGHTIAPSASASLIALADKQAQLIAAAPELLAALEMLIDWTGETGNIPPDDEKWQKAKEVINKAKGL